jgi:Uri superfamily endonuclease
MSRTLTKMPIPSVGRSNVTSVLPNAPGAYGLCLRFDETRDVSIGKAPPYGLPAGVYVYAGSAYGPGGLRARVARHLTEKTVRHWHADALDAHEKAFAVIVVPGGGECAVVDAATRLPRSDIPIPGFGSSDCRTCAAHLVRLSEGKAVAALARSIPNAALIWIAD